MTQRPNVLVVSYVTIRRAIGISGLLLPVALLLGGWVAGVPIQDNMSSYYHTPLRDIFVGTLCAIGVFMFCYRGYDRIENWTANLGGASALGIALFPLHAGSDPLIQKSIVGYLHTMFGGVFFLTLAFYSLYHFPRDSRIESEPHLRERSFVYRTSGLVILACMLAMGVYLFLVSGSWKERLNDINILLWLELIAVWSFASAWLAKGRTILAEIGIELLAYTSHLFIDDEPDAGKPTP